MSDSDGNGETDRASTRVDSFGAGCFHFTWKFSETFPSNQEYFESVKRLLESNSNISALKVRAGTAMSHFRDPHWRTGAHPVLQGKSTGLFPWPMDGSVEFTLFLPERMQADFVSGFRELPGVEKFDVNIAYRSSGLPTATVRASGGGHVESPSTMVVIVRKYLEIAFPGTGSDPKFQILGPSPYHADFFVSQTTAEGKYDLDWKERRGYDEVNITIPKGLDRAEYTRSSNFRVSYELSQFYAIVQQRVAIGSQAEEVLGNIDAQVAKRVDLRSRARLLRFGLPDDVVDLSLLTEQLDLASARFERFSADIVESLDKDFSPIFSKNKILEERRSVSNLPLATYRRMLHALETSHMLSSTNRTVIVAALVGALVSVAIGILFNFPSNHPSGSSASQLSSSSAGAGAGTGGAT